MMVMNNQKIMYKIKYCVSWIYKPQAESLAVEMNNHGFATTIEEGATGEFSLWEGTAYNIKSAGHGVFFNFEDVEELLKDHKRNQWRIWTK